MPQLNRRDLLLGALVGTTGTVIACAGGTGRSGVDASAGDDLVTPDGSPAGTWATGGTAALAADYAVDFDTSVAQTCELTLGPCYAETQVRKDISEGLDGLPTRLAFRVVDTDGAPVEGAVVDVWHCSPAGLYSGDDDADMCTGRDAEALASRWFRGQQTTDADGRVDFDTCMPGWYSSRAVHIHFQVLKGGNAWVVSQLGFEEALLANVFTTHPVYSPQGLPDTSNASDNILSGDADRLFDWDQADDGALVVWKTLVLRTSLSEPTC